MTEKQKNVPREILIRAPNWLGDNIFTFPAIRELRKRFPRARLVVLVRESLGPIWELVEEVDEIIVHDLKGGLRDLKRKLGLIRTLRARRFDLAAIFPRSFESALWTRLSGIPDRWGYAEEGRAFLLTRAPRSRRGYRHTHRMDYYYHLLNSAAGDKPAPPSRLLLSPELLDRGRRLIRKEAGDDEDGLLIGFHPRASYGPAKCWPLEKFVRLAKLLTRGRGAKILLFGSVKEGESLRELADQAGRGVINLAGRTGLKDLAALIALCRVLVANDSGPLHLAAALGVPVVGLYGSTDPSATGPRGKRVSVIYKNVECSPCLLKECPTDFKCMEEISPEEVMEEVVVMLK